MDKTTEFWVTVLWTDETKLELVGHMDQRYVWRAKGQAYDQKNTIPTVKHEGGSLMMWGGFLRQELAILIVYLASWIPRSTRSF